MIEPREHDAAGASAASGVSELSERALQANSKSTVDATSAASPRDAQASAVNERCELGELLNRDGSQFSPHPNAFLTIFPILQ